MVARCFGKLAVETVGPSMVAAREDFGGALVLLNHRVGTVSADVVEGSDVSASVAGYDEVKASDLVAEEITGFLEAERMGDN